MSTTPGCGKQTIISDLIGSQELPECQNELTSRAFHPNPIKVVGKFFELPLHVRFDIVN